MQYSTVFDSDHCCVKLVRYEESEMQAMRMHLQAKKQELSKAMAEQLQAAGYFDRIAGIA